MIILIQGAMDCELDVLIDRFKPAETKTINGYDFFCRNYKGNKIILCKTEIGIINATIATAIGIYEFHPDLVINQGCAGGHTPDIKRGDLIIGEKSVYINNFHTDAKAAGEGSDSLLWLPCKSRSYVVNSTKKYVELADGIEFDGRKYKGVIGSGDLFSKEIDRINYLHSLFGQLSEDMETVAAMKVCEKFNVDRIALRVISNNELTGESYDSDVNKTLQRFVISFVEKLVPSVKK